MRSSLLFPGSALIGLCLVSAFPGCGSSSNGNKAGDAGGDTASNDSSGGEAGDDGSSDASEEGSSSSSGGDDSSGGCTAAVMPKGTPLVASATDSVQGVTSDGQVVFYDASKKNLYAVPIGGGSPALVDAWDMSQSIIFTSNKVALYWNGAMQTTGAFGALSAWTSSGGAKALGTKSYVSIPGGGYTDVSPDGSLVLFTDNATATSADIYVAGSDGSNKTKLVTGASIGAGCRPIVRFAGSTPVVSYCTSQPDGGATLNATIAAYSGATWQTVQPFTSAGFYEFSIGSVPSGDGGAPTYSVEFVTSGGIYVEALGGTTPALIDAKGGGGVFTHSGTDLLYFGANGSIWRSPIATPAPGEIAAGPFAGIITVSGDDNWLELYTNADMTTGFSDMYLVSTTPADGGNSPTTLTTATTGANFGDAFTADDSRAIFFPDVTKSGTSGYIGTYKQLPLPPGMVKTIGQKVWEEFATTGAKTLYNDNYVPGVGFAGWADIEAIDLAGTSAAATTIVSQADANFFITADKKTIVYSWSACAGANEGIYTIAAP